MLLIWRKINGQLTFNLNREPRYYASLGFDRGSGWDKGSKDVSKSELSEGTLPVNLLQCI